MAYDQDLAERIRELLAAEPDVTEKRMFGGLAFLLGGRMAVAVSGRGGLMVRVAPGDVDDLLARDHVGPMVMKDRPVRGWVLLEPDGIRTKRQLQPWVVRGTRTARAIG